MRLRMLRAMRFAQLERPTQVGHGGAVMSIGLGAVADTAVRTEDLRRFFDETRAVDGVDLDVKTGEANSRECPRPVRPPSPGLR